jgi:8-oxo-dGTP diphosphatase
MSVVDVAAAVIQRPDGSFLLGQRAAETFYPGYWEFPGGKVEVGETPHQALVRELHEELEIDVLRATPWIVREYVYEHAHVRLHFFRVSEWRGELKDHVHAALEWQRPGAETVVPMLPANAPVLAALALPDFYGISHAHEIGAEAQVSALEHALAKGLRLVQLREGALPAQQRESFVATAVSLCRDYGARVLVNGDAQLAWAVGADGIHLTAAQLKALRGRPGFPLVAASCHDAEELKLAASAGLDLVLLGSIKPTASHPGAPALGWPEFTQLIKNYPLPVYAIGGLGRQDLDAAKDCGAQGIAAIRAAWLR